MRLVQFTGWIIFDEDECNHGENMVAQIDHELLNLDGVREWQLEETRNVEIDYNEEDEE